VPQGALARAISEPGRQYAVYLHHSRTDNVKYIVLPGSYQDALRLRLAPGSYRAEWVEPATGQVTGAEAFRHDGGERVIVSPVYAVDIALRIWDIARSGLKVLNGS